MDQPTAALIVGFTTALVTIAGWLTVHYFTRKRENEGRIAAAAQADRTKRLEILMSHYERQIEEFYGPIYSLIQLVWNLWSVKQDIIEKLNYEDNPQHLDEVHNKITQFLVQHYFTSIHNEIRDILKTKLYLIDSPKMPDSFYHYLAHAVMENVQVRLWQEAGISTKSVPGKDWSYQFPEDIKTGFDQAMKSYQETVAQLERPNNL